ncbi:MAG: hypothetical protein LUC35_08690 [Clostridiales bacterium]|nr:hypothetical protein [Clostridiales bacterium]
MINLLFEDTESADLQDRACSILLSLSMMADVNRREGMVNGETARVYRQEYQFHYETAVKNTLRLLGGLIGDVELPSESHIAGIIHNGYEGFESVMAYCEDALETEASF